MPAQIAQQGRQAALRSPARMVGTAPGTQELLCPLRRQLPGTQPAAGKPAAQVCHQPELISCRQPRVTSSASCSLKPRACPCSGPVIRTPNRSATVIASLSWNKTRRKKHRPRRLDYAEHQRSSSPLNWANPDLRSATRHNPALGITAVAPAGFSRASRWTVSRRLSRPSPSCGARGSAAAEGRPESDPGPIVAAVEPDELELGGMTAFRPAIRDRGRPAPPQNGPEAVTELADVRDPRAAHIARSACRMVTGPGAGHGRGSWFARPQNRPSHSCAPHVVEVWLDYPADGSRQGDPGGRRDGAKSTCLQARGGHADAAAHRPIGPDHRRSPRPG